MSYQYTTTEEEESEHGDSDAIAERLTEYLESKGLELDLDGNVVDSATKTKTTMVAIVCSCGLVACCMIGRYGHPRPVYSEEIEPIRSSQEARDKRALELKGGAL